MFAGQTHCLPYIRNYAEADAHWNKTKKPPRSKKWGEHQRPLKNTSSYHYRMEKNSDGSYDLVLYQTVMARFHKPDEYGFARAQYIGHDSQTSRNFMWDVLSVNAFKQFQTTDGSSVIAPITGRAMPGSEFSADLVFDRHGYLVVDKSKHTPIYRKHSSDDDKRERADIKSKFEPLLTLCAMRVPEFETTLEADFMRAGSFQLSGYLHKHERAIRELIDAFRLGREPLQQSIEHFMELAPLAYIKLVSDRAAKQGLIGWQQHTTSPLALDKRVTEKDLVRSLWATVQRHGGLKATTGVEQYPDFPTRDQLVLSNVSVYAK